MAIITYTKNSYTNEFLNMYPDQFVSEKEKQEDEWIKRTMDYFATVALDSYNRNKKSFGKNYDLVKGKLNPSDLLEEEEVNSFVGDIISNTALPKYIQHYSILNAPINTLLGEMSKRPDNTYIKAFDDESKSEQLQYKTEYLLQFITQKVRTTVINRLSMQGVDISQLADEDLQQITDEQLEQNLGNYTTIAEKWGSKTIEGLKVAFNMKEKSEEAFRDLLVSGREGFHIFKDKSERGFNIEVLNPSNVWYKTTPDQKYIADPFDPSKGAYCAGTIQVMEISEIIEKFDLSKEEIDHLRNNVKENYLPKAHPSNLWSGKTGIDSITYNPYDAYLYQEKLILEAEFTNEEINTKIDQFVFGESIRTFGQRFVVTRAYWMSKIKIGKLTTINEEGFEEVILVDENYKSNEHPDQVALEWGWVNQMYSGYKIGPDIYKVEPFTLLDYCPIIFSLFENKNAEVSSFVDLLKPFQSLYNIYINQLYSSLQKDWGNVVLTSIRHVPTLKDGDGQDSLEVFEETAKEKGVIFVDDSPENLKGPSSFNQHTVLQASRINEMQGYYNMAAQIKIEAWELVGISKARLGSVAATQTATGVSTELSQSYAQTEPWFAHHEYTMNKVYQAILDAAQYIESQKPTSTLSFLTNEGENAFITVNGADLKFRDLWCFVTSRSEDAQELRELKTLSQAMLQNGASPYEIAEIYSTKSKRQIKDSLKKLKQKQDEQIAQAQQLEQQKLQQQQEQFQQDQARQVQEDQNNRDYEAWQKELDRINKKEVALLNQLGRNENATADLNNNSIADPLETTRLTQDIVNANNSYNLENRKLAQQRNSDNEKLKLEYEKLKVKREEIENNLKIAKENKTKAEIKKPKKK